jgi:hypothetical protein
MLAGPVAAQPASSQAASPAPASSEPAASPLTILDVPFISQSEALCGGAAAAMILRYWGERGLTAESFAHLVDRSAAGIRTTALVGELRARGWDATGIAGTEAVLEGELARGRPVLTLIEDRPGTFHYIVAVAVTAGAIVFHDPARAPMRVMSRDEFARRWRPADRWMAIVVPGERTALATPERALTPVAGDTACERLVAEGIARAQANELDAAERSLTAALACPGPSALRELAGVRLLQRRWLDVSSLATAAVAIDPADQHAWRLLGTSRFVQNDRAGALAAWNHVGEPVVDLIAVSGLVRTRQRVIETSMGASPGNLLTPSAFLRARRRLEALPAAFATRLDYAPVRAGLVELRAAINERPVVPSDRWTYVGMAAMAAARREVDYGIASPSGGGELFAAGWRFWPDRPRYALTVATPAARAGVLRATILSERQPFDRPDLPRAERTAADVSVGNWLTSTLHAEARGGLEEWTGAGKAGRAGATLRLQSPGDRLGLRLLADAWKGTSAFGTASVEMIARTSTERAGRVLITRAGAGMATGGTPADAWFAGDTGATRAILLRAHPVIEDGELRTNQLGRRILHGSVEVQQWRRVSLARVGAAAFLDTARVGMRLTPGARGDVDVGAGVRLALPGVGGTFRGDLARGLRDGATTLSFVYEP